MNLQKFELERYFAQHEFNAPYLLSCSDCEPLSLQEVLSLADDSSLHMWEDLSLGYTESQGHPVLREEISRLYPGIVKGDLVVLAPEEGIFIAMNSILQEGDHVVTTFPGYQSLYEIARSLGCEVSRWTPRESEGWTFRIGDLQEAVRKDTKLLVVNFPHNPTGATLSTKEFKEIIEISDRRGITLFSDEMYRLLEYDEADRLPSAATLSENAVSLSGLSKSFSLAGLRIGWLATENSELLDSFVTFKGYTTICNSAPSEVLAIIALRSRGRILDRNLDIINRNLKRVDKFFSKYQNVFTWHPPQAGPVAFPKLTTDVDVLDFCSDLINKQGVLLVPSEVMNYEGNNFRVGFGRADTVESLERLEEYVKEKIL